MFAVVFCGCILARAAPSGTAPHALPAFRDCRACPEMVALPSGSFEMGSPINEAGHSSVEAPRHGVRIAAFALGRYAVTFAQWYACADAGGCGGHRPSDERWGRAEHPVINVSFEDAMRYVAWLQRRTGRPYRLPSEAEWEYAARAGTTSPFWTGGTITPSQANFDGEYPYRGSPRGAFRRRTLPVGTFAPNAYGLYDMNGNAAQWVADCMHADYAGAPDDGSAWAGDQCGERIVRGGSWGSEATLVRSAMRFGVGAAYRSSYVGFRVALSVRPEI
jgi:formylglycine-generating enzyme required for sulfatase activity